MLKHQIDTVLFLGICDFLMFVMSQISQRSFKIKSRLYFEAAEYFYLMTSLFRQWKCESQSEEFNSHFYIDCTLKAFEGVLIPVL